MKLENKKAFAAKVLGVGKGRIIFNSTMLADIKEAMTRQDIKELAASGAISIREVKGRKKKEKRKTRRRAGSRRMILKHKKRTYVNLTRKLRAYLVELLGHNLITKEIYLKLRREIRAHSFKDKTHMKERLEGLKAK
jgi:ribosomal protein L19E